MIFKLPKTSDIWAKLKGEKKMTASEEFMANYRPILGTDEELERFDRLMAALIDEVEQKTKGRLNEH